MKSIHIFLAGAALFTMQVLTAQPKLSKDNIDAVLSAMTLREKATLLVGSIDGTNYTGIPIPTGGEGEQQVPGAAGQTATLSRLGIPPTVEADGPAGVRVLPHRSGSDATYFCTGFPVEILLSSTWNAPLVETVGQAMGNEALEYGVDAILAPATNIMRNPLCGRNFEYFSEDPILAGKMTAAITRGIQSQGVGTSVKHFAANNQETNRGDNDAIVSARSLREIYLKPFEIAVKEAQPWTVMSSYNRIQGTYTQESHDLLTKVLRNDWGFRGLVMTDWTGQRNTSAQVHAGNDLMMPGVKAQIEQIVADVEGGILSEKDVDICVRRVLEYIVKTPRFAGYRYSDNPDLASHARVSLEGAREGIVLLKNDGNTLPLEGKGKVALFGMSSYRFIHDGFGSGHVNTPYIVSMVDALERAGFTLDEDLQNLYGHFLALEDAKFRFSPLSKIPLLDAIGLSAHIEELPVEKAIIEATAADDDLAVITIGRKPGEGFDRNADGDFTLKSAEKELIEGVCEAFHAEGKKVVVVLNVGGVVETASWKALPDAIVLAWMPGQEGGTAVADVLTGKVNPSGRLPITFPLRYQDVPGWEDFPYDQGNKYDDGMLGLTHLLGHVGADKNSRNIGRTVYSEGIYVGYRHYVTRGFDVSYPFGYGLSYTNFSVSKPTVRRRGDQFELRVTVTNTGTCAGKEVVQAYVSAPKGKLDKPVRELKAFGKTGLLAPGASETLVLTFSAYDLASFDEDLSAFVTDKGKYLLQLSSNADEVLEETSFSVSREYRYPVSRVF